MYNFRRRICAFILVKDKCAFGINGNIDFIIKDIESNGEDFIKDSCETIVAHRSETNLKVSWIWHIGNIN